MNVQGAPSESVRRERGGLLKSNRSKGCIGGLHHICAPWAEILPLRHVVERVQTELEDSEPSIQVTNDGQRYAQVKM